MRTNLVVPFAEKDRAKKLGARWDAARKVWYVEGIENLSAFAEWMPDQTKKPTVGTATLPPVVGTVQARQPNQHGATKSAGVMTGAKVVAIACDCLPWVGCEKCQPALAAMGWGAKA